MLQKKFNDFYVINFYKLKKHIKPDKINYVSDHSVKEK